MSRHLLDLPFRASPRLTPRASRSRRKATSRAADLPFDSQLGAGATQFRNDCGPACVRMALDFLSLAPGVTIDELQLQLNRIFQKGERADEGTTAVELEGLANAFGAQASALRLSPSQLPEPPAIVLVRYNGFARDTVEDKRYWDLVNAQDFRHWMWWLGTSDVDGRVVSVWNDPLFSSAAGKGVMHPLGALDAAFVPYFGFRFAITFAGMRNPPASPDERLTVFAFDEGGVRLRSSPTTQDPNNAIDLTPQGQRFSVLESAESARLKLASGGQTQWLRVRTTLDGVEREGFVAAWLVRLASSAEPTPEPIPAPPPPVAITSFSWQDVINATTLVATQNGQSWQDWLGQVGFWQLFNNSLRKLPYTGSPIDQWQLAAEHRRKIIEALALGSDELVRRLIEVLEGQPPAPKPATPARGSIIGVHGAPGVGAPPRSDWDEWVRRLKSIGVGWFKQCENDDLNQRDVFEWAKRLKQEGIEPIIRYFVGQQFPNPLPDAHFEKMKWYAESGIAFAEIGNEPNLDHEWQGHWHGRVDFNNPEVVRLLAEGWVRDAQRALSVGVRPAFYALGPTDWNGGTHPTLSSVMFARRLAAWLADRRRDETLDIFARGGWLAVHSATYEQPPEFDPHRPDGSVWDMSLRGYEVAREAFRDAFGAALNVNAIPIISTEGGVFTPESTSMANRPRLNEGEHAQATVRMFAWLEANSPLTAMCPWCVSAQGLGGPFDEQFRFDGWFRDGRALPVVDALQRLRAERESAGARALPRQSAASAKAERRAQLERELREIGIFRAPKKRTPKPKKRPTVRRRTKTRK